MLKNYNFLLIAYDFPPLNSGGSLRPYRFAVFLKKHYSLNPIVITVDHEKYNNTYVDKSPKENFSVDLRVIRTKINKHSKISRLIDSGYFFLPDSILFRWRSYLKKEILKVIVNDKPKFLLLTVPPFSLLGFIHNLAKKYNIPVVYDFRDPLSFWVSSPFPSKLHYLYHKATERKCIKNSYRTIVVTPEMKNIYSKMFPTLGANIFVVYNSFDSYEKSTIPDLPNSTEKKFSIGYLGSFYYVQKSAGLTKRRWWKKRAYQYLQYIPFQQDWEYRTPYYFFSAVSMLLKKNPEYKDRVELLFAGAKPEWFENMIEQFDLRGNVFHYGFISKKEVKSFQNQCNAFLITSAKIEKGRDYCIAGKTYEYFAQGKPIVAFVTEGDQKWIVQNSGLGIICDPDQIEDSALKLKNYLDSKNELTPEKPFIDTFLTHNQVSKLFEVIKPLLRI